MNEKSIRRMRKKHAQACEGIGLKEVTTIFAHPDDIASIEQHAAQLADARGYRNAVFSVARHEEVSELINRRERWPWPYPYIKDAETTQP